MTPESARTLLLETHPLFRRLSGQIVWLLLEEQELSEAAIGAFLDRIEELRQATIQLMVDVAAGHGPAYLELVRGDGGNPLAAAPEYARGETCADCARIAGRVIDTSAPDWQTLLPPYGLGCRLCARPWTRPEAPDTALLLSPAELPTPKLTCDSEWIFRTDWAAVCPS